MPTATSNDFSMVPYERKKQKMLSDIAAKYSSTIYYTTKPIWRFKLLRLTQAIHHQEARKTAKDTISLPAVNTTPDTQSGCPAKSDRPTRHVQSAFGPKPVPD